MADYTEHYQLHQWQPQDPFLRTDFNEDLQKIDNTLRQLADTAATQGEELNQRGNCTIVSGNYIGTGTTGESGSCSLSFAKRPLFVVVVPSKESDSSSTLYRLLMMQGSTHAFTNAEFFESTCTVAWNENGVSWYNYGVADYQCNEKGMTYLYVGFLSAGNDV